MKTEGEDGWEASDMVPDTELALKNGSCPVPVIKSEPSLFSVTPGLIYSRGKKK